MKKKLLSRLPNFKNDEEIAAFMEKHSAFDLLDADLAEIVPSTPFMIERESKPMLLKAKRVQVAFKDEKALQKAFSSKISSSRTFIVVDTDATGILVSLSDSAALGLFYVPYLNISGIRLLERTKNKEARADSSRNKFSTRVRAK